MATKKAAATKRETEHEIRFRGTLLSHHASEADAIAHADEHHTDPDHDEYREEFTIAPRKPFELHVRGNLVDTFDSLNEANHGAKKVWEAMPRHARDAEVFEIVDRSNNEKTMADRVGEPSSPTEPSGPPDWSAMLPPL